MKSCFFINLFLTAHLAAALDPTSLTCEGRKDPAGIDLAKPKLGWAVESTARGARQSAYQIIAVTDDRKTLWDSGKVESDETNGLSYAGQPLTSSQAVLWKVRVWDEKGEASAWSAPAKWTMGLLQQNDWGSAQWIGAPDDTLPSVAGPKAENETVLLRREFTVRPGLKRAVIHVCGLGQYEMKLNGAKVGTDLLTPGWTKYERTVLYDTYDVTASLKAGPNALGLLLDNGMYISHTGRYIKGKGWVFGPLQAIAKLQLEYQDGKTDTLVTDPNWLSFSGPITFSSPFGGMDYDARLEPVNWDKPGFDDKKWEQARQTKGTGGKLAGLSVSAEPIRESGILKPISKNEISPGITIYDLGQNTSLIPKIKVHGPAGSSIKIVPAELLNAKGGLNDPMCKGNSIWTYTLAGTGAETPSLDFFYRGARYLQLELKPAQEGGALPVVDSLEATVVHTDSKPVSEFNCSNDLFNKTYQLVRWAQRSNTMSVITDCPTREKLGWIEQTHLNGPSLRYSFDLNALFAKSVNDMSDSQTDSGLIPSTAPEYTIFGGAFRDSPEWGSSFIVVPWQQYEFTGDPALLARHYDQMKKYVSYLDNKAKEDILDFGLGDWFDIGPNKPGQSQLTPKALTATAYYFYDHWILSQVATVLGNKADAEKYAKRADEIRAAFDKRFFDPKTNQYATGSQCANAIPIVMNIVEPANRHAVLENLVADALEKSITAGDIGYRYLLRALADGGRSDVIFKINNQSDKPGYGYQLKQGATSLTEAWDAGQRDSQNHFMLGQINEWFFHDLAGIQPDATGPGFKKFIIKPAIVGGEELTWVKARYDSTHGRIESGWQRKGDQLTLHVTVPANTTATVYVPARQADGVKESNAPAASAAGLKWLRMDGTAAVFTAQPGKYTFESQLPTL